ncbi:MULTISPECIES: DEAD/DEAH box helicase family protein [Bacillus]|uniref:DEAD/DEAH box helicase family protein n=1 Tax=Bacillus TaxID=1386 RepID=UPI0015CF59D5|nr:DEAD/DEAH box helicase family protein [Bacillus toyonensis]
MGHFDLIIVDESHRSIYKTYHAIIEYFDVYISTNTQKDEIDKNVYEIFSIEKGALQMHMNLNSL